jgi:hypothetical protein
LDQSWLLSFNVTIWVELILVSQTFLTPKLVLYLGPFTVDQGWRTRSDWGRSLCSCSYYWSWAKPVSTRYDWFFFSFISFLANYLSVIINSCFHFIFSLLFLFWFSWLWFFGMLLVVGVQKARKIAASHGSSYFSS